MQNRRVPDFIKRSQYYTAHSYTSQALKAADHITLRPVIFLAIANHDLFPSKTKVISYHKTLDTDSHEHDLKDLSYCFIELANFSSSFSGFETPIIFLLLSLIPMTIIPPAVFAKATIDFRMPFRLFVFSLNSSVFPSCFFIKSSIIGTSFTRKLTRKHSEVS